MWVPSKRKVVYLALFLILFPLFLHLSHSALLPSSLANRPPSLLLPRPLHALLFSQQDLATRDLLGHIAARAQQIVDDPLSPSQFSELGERLQLLRGWIETLENRRNSWRPEFREYLALQIDRAALSDLPFLRNPSRGKDPTPLDTLRGSYKQGSKGLVIPVGRGTFRYACHLVSSLRWVLESQLPIEIVYAGEDDLPKAHRDMLGEIGGHSIKMVDITTVFDDATLGLAKGGWAIKPFAVLGSSFEQVILMDADAVFAQAPDAIFDGGGGGDEGYGATGTMFFHDRLLWKGAYPERHAWWEVELGNRTPSAALQKSKVYNYGYAEEMDSGVVALDKRRLPLFMGLLHVCWQNAAAVREQFTYSMTYGDKESWWFGLELSGAPYSFEAQYGAVVGSKEVVDHDDGGGGRAKVCSFTIAHFDANGKLLWYNGSLLKNKAVDGGEFAVPSHGMVDGTWKKGETRADVSCMEGGDARELPAETQEVIAASVERAKAVDAKIGALVDG